MLKEKGSLLIAASNGLYAGHHKPPGLYSIGSNLSVLQGIKADNVCQCNGSC